MLKGFNKLTYIFEKILQVLFCLFGVNMYNKTGGQFLPLKSTFCKIINCKKRFQKKNIFPKKIFSVVKNRVFEEKKPLSPTQSLITFFGCISVKKKFICRFWKNEVLAFFRCLSVPTTTVLMPDGVKIRVSTPTVPMMKGNKNDKTNFFSSFFQNR